jgi:anti-sigma regulatory factor (Ser/Thr protein kinase)
VAAHAASCGFDEAGTFRLQLALTEALANIVEHGYGPGAEGQIRLQALGGDGRLELAIEDSGRPFDEAGYRPPDLDRPTEGGYGVYLMRELMDEVSYHRLGGSGKPGDAAHNRLRLVCYARRDSDVGAG